ARQAMLGAENDVEVSRESFRSQTDEFKLLIGMPVDEPLGRENLEDIESIERQIEDGRYPLLQASAAIADEQRAIEVALARRFDLLTVTDRIGDARRGVSISANALLPDLNFTGSLNLDTDPNSFNVGELRWERANWRAEVLLELPLERTVERAALRRALIDVSRAQRTRQDTSERIRAEVRRAVNVYVLAERSLAIQQKSLEVAEMRREYSAIMFENGEISNREKVEAEDALLAARNDLNFAKTSRWTALLQFRLSTETLVIDEDGVQVPEAEAAPVSDGVSG
ncbi:MAG: TolC family protein, partial [Planctomycetota bacterium]